MVGRGVNFKITSNCADVLSFLCFITQVGG